MGSSLRVGNVSVWVFAWSAEEALRMGFAGKGSVTMTLGQIG